MRVSVIIPAFNNAKTLSSTVDSALRQTRPAEEIVIVDDGSTDRTAEIAASLPPPVRFFRQENQGAAVARNRAIAESRGELLAFLDADDLWVPEKLAVQVPAFERDVGLVFSFANARNLAADGSLGRPFVDFAHSHLSLVRHRREGEIVTFEEDLQPFFLLGCPASTPGVMARRDAALRAGGFDPALRRGQDLDLWLRLAGLGRCNYVDRVLYHRRLHDSNVTQDTLRIDRAQIDILTPWLGRRVAWKPGQRQAFVRRLAGLNLSVGWRLRKRGESMAARTYLRQSLRYRFRLKALLLWGLAGVRA